MQLNFSFYNQKYSKFYGRTYSSQRFRGVIDKDYAKWDKIIEELYFHSKYIDKEIFLIVDICKIYSSKNGQVSDDQYYSWGFFIGMNFSICLSYISILVDLFEKKSSEEKKNDESKTANIYLIKDSPRWLLIKNKLEVLMKNPVPVTNSKLYIEKIIKKRDLESM